MQLLRGGPGGLSAGRARLIERPAPARGGLRHAACGWATSTATTTSTSSRAARRGPPAPGHATFCRGSSSGPRRCRAFGGSDGTSGLAVGDVNHDGYEDIVQGDPQHEAAAGRRVVRLWLGGRHGPRATPILITQDTRAIPGEDEPGDQFGAVVEAGDLDLDGYADMIVAATGENDGAGRVTVIRGASAAATRASATRWFDQSSPNVPGARRAGGGFGSTLAVLASPPTAGPTSRWRRAASIAPTRA